MSYRHDAEGGYRTICDAHVDDPVLKGAIVDYSTETTCSFCDREGTEDAPVAAPFEDFMDAFMVGVHHRYARAADEGVIFEEGDFVGTTYGSEEVAEEILEEAFVKGIKKEDVDLLEAVQAAMEPDAWVSHGWQWPTYDENLTDSWDRFKDLVKHRTRFLFMVWHLDDGEPSTNRYTMLGEMAPAAFFEFLARLLLDLPGVYRVVPAGTAIYRGRMFKTYPPREKLTAETLGSPPVREAAANRMSPAGISMFYGASDAATAVAEIGAHSPHVYAAVGKFVAARDLQVIDLSHVPAGPSIFDADEKAQKRYSSLLFLRRFLDDLTLPVTLDGKEHIDYVPTQVFTEYLRFNFPGDLDALMFPSTQADGDNFVVFYGPDGCSPHDNTSESTVLSLDKNDITIDRVTTVIRPE